MTEPTFACPAGTTKIGRWDEKPRPPPPPGTPPRSHPPREMYCAKGRVKHGPYAYIIPSWHGNSTDKTAFGEYRDGVKQGWWTESSGLYAGSRGTYRDGQRHGVWRELTKNVDTRTVYLRGVLVGVSLTIDSATGVVRERRGTVERVWKKDGSWRLQR